MRKLYLLTTSLLCLFFSANSQDTASFTFTIGTNNQVNFVNKSVLHGDALRKAHWSFGDGTRQVTPPLANVFHQYNAGGSYTVCLRIYKYSNTTHDSAITAEFCKKIELPNTTRPDSCKASFTNLGTNSGILTQLFIAQPGHNHDKRPEQICWSFGDGKDTCISYNPALASNYALYHTYEKPGVYKVCVKIRYQGGCVADYCREIKVGHEEECKIDFKTEPVSASPFTRHFIAYPAHSQQKKPVKICWDFGDGTTECKQFATTNTDPYAIRHTYAKPGKYNVCVSVLFDGGCEAKICKTIAIETPPPPPPADTCFVKIVEVATNAHNLERIFHADIRPDRRLEKICWIFGDGQDTCINLPNPTTTPQQPLSIKHRFPAPGVYRVCVKVKYVGGCETHNCIEVVIRPFTNICGGYMTDSLAGPKTFVFKGFGVHNSNDHITGWRWTFGDGTSETGQHVKHTYAAAGKYEVCLYIKTDAGCETKICKTVVVRGENQPKLQLSPNPVTTTLYAVFISSLQEQVTISIFNANGILLKTYTRGAVVGTNKWEFNVSGLPRGVYTVIVKSPHQFANGIFFKQ